MTTRKLENDRETLLEKVLFPSQVTLAREKRHETDERRLKEIDAELDQIFAKIDEIIDEQIKELTDYMLADPEVQKDMKEIRKGTKDAKEASKAVKQATDKLKAVKKAVDKTIKPIEQFAKFFA